MDEIILFEKKCLLIEDLLDEVCKIAGSDRIMIAVISNLIKTIMNRQNNPNEAMDQLIKVLLGKNE